MLVCLFALFLRAFMNGILPNLQFTACDYLFDINELFLFKGVSKDLR